MYINSLFDSVCYHQPLGLLGWDRYWFTVFILFTYGCKCHTFTCDILCNNTHRGLDPKNVSLLSIIKIRQNLTVITITKQLEQFTSAQMLTFGLWMTFTLSRYAGVSGQYWLVLASMFLINHWSPKGSASFAWQWCHSASVRVRPEHGNTFNIPVVQPSNLRSEHDNYW